MNKEERNLMMTLEKRTGFDPIVLDTLGAAITPPKVSKFLKIVFDPDIIPEPNSLTGDPVYVATHQNCHGEIYRHPNSAGFDTLCCEKCCRTFPIPKETQTYGQLRSYCSRSLTKTRDVHESLMQLQAPGNA